MPEENGGSDLRRPLRILHLEDNPRDAEMVRHRLEAGGVACDIVLVNSKESFEGALARTSYDLLFVDYSLHGYSGVLALKRAHDFHPDVPVILISGTVPEEVAVQCLHLGATDYLLKGRLERLVPAVERAIHEAQTRVRRRQAEAAVREERDWAQRYLDTAEVMLLSLDLEGRITQANRYACALLDRPAEELLGRDFVETCLPYRDRDAVRARFRVQPGGGLSTFDQAVVRRSGETRTIEWRNTTLQDDFGSGCCVISCGTDITDRINAELALRKTGADLAARTMALERQTMQLTEQTALLDLAQDAIIVRSMDNRIQFWSRGAEAMYGWRSQEALGRSKEELLKTEFSEPTAQIYATLLRNGRWEGEAVQYRRDGTRVDTASRWTLERDADGAPVRILSINNDISERKHADAERLTMVNDLQSGAIAWREGEERVNYALGAALMGVWQLDLASKRLTWSETMAPVFGLTSPQAPPDFQMFIALIHPDDRQRVQEGMASAELGGTDFKQDFRALWPDGSAHWIAGQARLLRDANDKPLRWLGVCTDIGERKSLEAQFRQAQKMEAIGQLAGGLAHDFNNLLTAILGYSNCVLDTLGPHDGRRADVEEVIKSGQRAASLTRQLLAFSRKQVLQPTAVDLNALVTGIRPMLGRLIGEHVDLVPILATDLCLARADPGQLEQVVMNLVVNARDAMPSGGRVTLETANVRLDASFMQEVAIQPGPYVMLAVGDSGVGMDQDTKRRLFEPFFTTKEAGKGTGLGLATVYGIVKQSDGYISVESEPGHGATFKVYLPCAVGEQAADMPVAVNEAIAGATDTVLLLEDEDGVRLLAHRILERAGYRVFDAPTPQQAEALFEQHTDAIDILVTDVIMPGLTGRQVFDRLARLRPGLKVLYMSGYTNDEIVHQGQLDPGV
ncbi:MAG: PAS domain S-box protein, partial [Acidobacteriota bacterium]